MVAHVFPQRPQYRGLQQPTDHVRSSVFNPRQGGPIDQFAHAEVILDLGFGKEFVQGYGSTRLIALEQDVLIFPFRREGHFIIFPENHFVGRIQAA